MTTKVPLLLNGPVTLRLEKREKRRTVLSCDQSLNDAGIAIVDEALEIRHYEHIKFASHLSHYERRTILADRMHELGELFSVDFYVVEKVRQFSTDKKTKKNFISMDVITAHSKIISAIIHRVYPKSVYSVPTQDWKYRVLGERDATKRDALQYVQRLTGTPIRNHNSADACCMGIAAWTETKLYLED